MSQPRYPGALPVHEVARRLSRAMSAPDRTFWPDSESLCDSKRFRLDRAHGSGQLTDLYLLGLAVARGGRLATFDRAIPLTAVPGATAAHVASI